MLPEGNEHLPIVLAATDIRTPKVEQILANDTVQVNWWFDPSVPSHWKGDPRTRTWQPSLQLGGERCIPKALSEWVRSRR